MAATHLTRASVHRALDRQRFDGCPRRYSRDAGPDTTAVTVTGPCTGRNGREIEELLGGQAISRNKHFIPFCPLPVTETCGIRVGTRMMTTVGAVESDMVRIVEWIDRAVAGEDVQSRVHEFMLEREARKNS